MSKISIAQNVGELVTSPTLTGISKVHLDVSDTLWYEAGDNSGRTITLQNPWGTQAMCNNILKTLRGYQHQPFSAEDAILDPAAELWDGVSIGDTYGGIGEIVTTFDKLLTANVASPGENVIDHEYPSTPRADRKIVREFADIRASLRVQADQIAAEVANRTTDTQQLRSTLQVQAGQIGAKVSRTGGDDSSFGWNMTDTSQVWKANNREIFRLDRNGAKVTGEIRATSGTIGGFDIGKNDLRYNNQDWQGTNSTGIYLGTNGIQLGAWDGGAHIARNGDTVIGNLTCKKITAQSGDFNGTVHASNIKSGGSSGYFNGSGITPYTVSNGHIVPNSLNTASMVGSISTSLANGNYANDVVTGRRTATLINASTLIYDGCIISRSQTTISGQTIRYLGWTKR